MSERTRRHAKRLMSCADCVAYSVPGDTPSKHGNSDTESLPALHGNTLHDWQRHARTAAVRRLQLNTAYSQQGTTEHHSFLPKNHPQAWPSDQSRPQLPPCYTRYQVAESMLSNTYYPNRTWDARLGVTADRHAYAALVHLV